MLDLTVRERNSLGKVAIGFISAAMLMACAPTHASVETTAQAQVQDEADQKAEAQDKKKRVKIITRGPSVEIKGKAGERDKLVIRSRTLSLKDRLAATETARIAIKEAIADMEERIAEADGFEKEVLEDAIDGLRDSLEDLNEEEGAIVEFHREMEEEGERQIVIMREVLADLKDEELELDVMRKDVVRELADARRDIKIAIDDLEIDIDSEGDMARIHIEALKQAAKELEMNEEEHLEAIRRAEEELRRAREELEREIQERVQREKAAADETKDLI